MRIAGIALALVCALGVLPRAPYAVAAMLLALTALLRRQALRLVLFAAVAFAFLHFCAFTRSPDRRFVSEQPDGYYTQLAQSFSAGRLSMPQVPAPGLALLKNPHSWAEAARFSPPPDISYYRGKFYIYWGIAPVITLVWPHHLLTGKFLTESFLVTWYAWLAVLAFFLAGRKWMERRQDRPTGAAQELFLFAALLFCTLTGAVARHTDVYQIAIFSGLAHAGFALWIVQHRRPRADAAAGALWSLAFASRPTLAAAILPVLALRFAGDRAEARPALRTAIRFALGALPVCALVAVYNYLRFDDPFEFGYRRLISLWDFSEWRWDTTSTLLGIWATLFQPWHFSPEFPGLRIGHFGDGWLLLRHRYLHDVNVGLFAIAPFAALAFARLRRSETVALAFLLAAGAMIVGYASRAGFSLRYTMECGYFAVTAAAVLLQSPTPLSKLARGAAFALLWIAVNAGILLALEPGKVEFRYFSPDAFQFLDHWLMGR